MITRIFPQILKQFLSRAFTNPFPAAHMPPSLTEALSSGASSLTPPLPVGKRFRGRLDYDRDKCIGCRLCIKVCPAQATEFLPESKKIAIHNDRCCFCAQCTEICPVKCLVMSDVYMISSYNRKENVVTGADKR
jgi:formate hydrogenlyase subunit 6/NADH:ubiquinone oxidoreductase subunit I